MSTCIGCGTPPVPAICTPGVVEAPVFFRAPGVHTPVPGFVRTTTAADCTTTVDHVDASGVSFGALLTIVEVQYVSTLSGTPGGTGGPVNWADIVDRVTAPIASQNTSVAQGLAARQPTLVSGLNIKTINGQSVLGSGDLAIAGGSSSYPEALSFSALPSSPAEGTTYVVLQPQGVYFVNRKPAGLYRYTSSAWVYLGEVPDGYFTDNVLRFFDNGDPTKQLAFELSGISTGTTRTLTVPDASGTIALTSDTRFTDAREWTAATIDQAEAEAGTATTRRAWTAQRVWQAITKALGGVTVTNTPTSGQVLKATSATTAAWGTDETGGGGGGPGTNLSYTPAATGGTVVSDSGTDATLPLADGTNAGLMAPAQHTKLAGIAAGATANATDAQLRDRATHTGAQPISSVSGLQTALDGKEASGTAAAAVAAHVAAADPHPGYALESALGTAAYTASTAYATAAQGTDAREWTAATIDQAEAEAGTATTRRAFTAQRVFQAIAAWWAALTVPASKVSVATEPLSAPKTLTAVDAGKTFTLASTQAITVPAGLGAAWGCALFDGACTFVADGTTVTDSRVSGAGFAQCALVQIGANAYRVVGTSA